MSDDFLQFIQKVLPKARRLRIGIEIPKQDPSDLAELLELEGAVKQDTSWCPVSKKTAEKVFDDPEVEGMYFMSVVLDSLNYDFTISADGTHIHDM